MNLPTTRRGCIDLYEKRRKSHAKKTKLDMYLGGMICASNDEFRHRKQWNGTKSIGGTSPCLCKNDDASRHSTVCRSDETCAKSTEQTLRKPWDGDLYD